MDIIDPTKNANDEYSNWRELTSQLTNSIKQQEHCYTVSDENIKNCKCSIKKERKDKHLNILTSLQEQISSKIKSLNNIAQERGSSGWLTVLPINQFGFSLSKAEFWDAVYHCGCAKVYTVQHGLSCKKGGFVTLNHNELCDNIGEMLQEVIKRILVSWIKDIFRCKDFWSKCSTPWKQNTQNILWIEWIWEEKRLQPQDSECLTRFVYFSCFLDNRWCKKRMLDVCQTIVSDDINKTKRRT